MDCRTQAGALADMQTRTRLKHFTGVARISTTCSSGHPSGRNAPAVASSPVRSTSGGPPSRRAPGHRISHRRVAHRPEAEHAGDRRQPFRPPGEQVGLDQPGHVKAQRDPPFLGRPCPSPAPSPGRYRHRRPAARAPRPSAARTAASARRSPGPGRCGSSTLAGGNPVQAGDARAVSAPCVPVGAGRDRGQVVAGPDGVAGRGRGALAGVQRNRDHDQRLRQPGNWNTGHVGVPPKGFVRHKVPAACCEHLAGTALASRRCA